MPQFAPWARAARWLLTLLLACLVLTVGGFQSRAATAFWQEEVGESHVLEHETTPEAALPTLASVRRLGRAGPGRPRRLAARPTSVPLPPTRPLPPLGPRGPPSGHRGPPSLA